MMVSIFDCDFFFFFPLWRLVELLVSPAFLHAKGVGKVGLGWGLPASFYLVCGQRIGSIAIDAS